MMSFVKGVAFCVANIRNNCVKAKHYYVVQCTTDKYSRDSNKAYRKCKSSSPRKPPLLPLFEDKPDSLKLLKRELWLPWLVREVRPPLDGAESRDCRLPRLVEGRMPRLER